MSKMDNLLSNYIQGMIHSNRNQMPIEDTNSQVSGEGYNLNLDFDDIIEKTSVLGDSLNLENGINNADDENNAYSLSKYMLGTPSINAGKTLLSKIAPKTAAKFAPKAAAKLVAKAGLRFIPGIGWAMAGLDALDYGTGIYNYLPGGEYLTWRDDYENKFPSFDMIPGMEDN